VPINAEFALELLIDFVCLPSCHAMHMHEVAAPQSTHTQSQTHALACSCSTATTAHNLVVCALLCDDAPIWLCCVSLSLGLGEIVTLSLVLWWRGADESCGSFMCTCDHQQSIEPTPTPHQHHELCAYGVEKRHSCAGGLLPACCVYLVVRAGVVAGAPAHAACVCVCVCVCALIATAGSSEACQI
jgi:hypothetical protein